MVATRWLQQYLPFTVLKLLCVSKECASFALQQYIPFTVLKRKWCTCIMFQEFKLQQYLLFTVCDEECEAAEEQSDDEVRTSLVPDQREGKTEVIK